MEIGKLPGRGCYCCTAGYGDASIGYCKVTAPKNGSSCRTGTAPLTYAVGCQANIMEVLGLLSYYLASTVLIANWAVLIT